MPVMDGLEATKLILAEMKKLTPVQFCDSKIVAVTANSGQQIKDECK